MNPLPVFSAEVFHDRDFGPLPTEHVESALEYVGSIFGVGGIAVVGLSRQIKIARNPNQPLIGEYSHIQWPQFNADINVVLTARSLHYFDENDNDKRKEALGFAFPGGHERAGVAVIDVESSPATTPVAIHEVGHLFSLKNRGITRHPKPTEPHCVLDNCAMNAVYEHRPLTHKVEENGAKKVLEILRLRTPQYYAVEDRVETLCTECTDQLGQVAYLRRLARTGVEVPSELID